MNEVIPGRWFHLRTHIRSIHVLRRLVPTLVMFAILTAVVLQDATADRKVSIASHIPESPANAQHVVSVISQKDIELSGMRNVSELLLSRAVYNAFGIYKPLILGSSRTAVFINGRRISDSTLDLGTLPISAVEHIEVLSDSATGLQGGHAIGGAINIVLKRDYSGFEVQASVSPTEQAGGDSGQGSLLWGGPLGDGHITLGADFFQRDEIRDKQRVYSRATWTPGGSFADTGGVSEGGNTLFVTIGRDTTAYPLGACEGSAYTGPLSNPRGISGTGCGFAYSEISWHTQRYDRESLFLNFDHPLGENMDMYVDIRAAQRDSKDRFAPSVGTFNLASDTIKQELLQDLGVTAPPDSATLFLSHRFIGHGNREWRTDLEEYDLTLGLHGKFASDIGYDAHLRYYQDDTDVTGDTFVSESLFGTVIDSYNIEDPRSQESGHLSAIRETGLKLKRKLLTEHKTVHVSFDGTAFAMGGGTVRWAAGGAYAHEKRRNVYDYLDINGNSHDAEDVLGSGGNSATGERRRKSAFAELFLPLHSEWNVVLAGWHDDYDDVGSEFSHLITSEYRLHKNFSVRGSWSEGASTPSLNAQHGQAALDYPYICDTKTHTGDLGDCRKFQVERISSGNPDLELDETESFSFGAAANLGPFSLAADWFQIEISDIPERLFTQSIVDLEVAGKLPPGVVVTREGDVITQIRSPWVNSGEVDIEGVNIQIHADWKTTWADMAFTTRWLHISRDKRWVNNEVQPGDRPHNRVHASLRMSRGRVAANWNLHAISGYSNVDKTDKFDSWMGHDLVIQWRDAFGLSKMEIQGGVLNIGDHGPSKDPKNPSSVALTLDSTSGRTLFLNAKFSLDP